MSALSVEIVVHHGADWFRAVKRDESGALLRFSGLRHTVEEAEDEAARLAELAEEDEGYCAHASLAPDGGPSDADPGL